MGPYFFRFGSNKEKSKDGEGEESSKGASLEPDYGLSGKLTAETNTFRVGYVVKFVTFDLLCGDL